MSSAISMILDRFKLPVPLSFGKKFARVYIEYGSELFPVDVELT